MKSGASSDGFTLVEVMVALAVVAIALPALLLSFYQQVDSTAYLRDKSLAHMVAANKLTEMRIVSRARQSLFQGRESGVAQLGDRDWYWWAESKPTEMEQFYRLEIRVASEETDQEQPLHTLVAFFSGDLSPDAEPANAGG